MRLHPLVLPYQRAKHVSRKVVNDQCSTFFRNASVRGKVSGFLTKSYMPRFPKWLLPAADGVFRRLTD